MIYFTADQHFGHENINRLCGRPFASASEAWEVMRENHNRVVKPDDDVYHLGDFCWSPKNADDIRRYLSELNGHHILVAGNHDKCHPMHRRAAHWRGVYRAAGFHAVETHIRFHHPEIKRTLLCHIPIGDARFPRWSPSEVDGAENGWILCGHVHEKWKVRGRCVNVGVDQWEFRPVSVVEVREAMRANPDFVQALLDTREEMKREGVVVDPVAWMEGQE